LRLGADSNCGSAGQWQARGAPQPATAVEYLLCSYLRDPAVLDACIDVLAAAGGRLRHADPAVVVVIRDDSAGLSQRLDADAEVLHRRFADLDFGTTAVHMLALRGDAAAGSQRRCQRQSDAG
jgi:hypothetical protein